MRGKELRFKKLLQTGYDPDKKTDTFNPGNGRGIVIFKHEIFPEEGVVEEGVYICGLNNVISRVYRGGREKKTYRTFTTVQVPKSEIPALIELLKKYV